MSFVGQVQLAFSPQALAAAEQQLMKVAHIFPRDRWTLAGPFVVPGPSLKEVPTGQSSTSTIEGQCEVIGRHLATLARRVVDAVLTRDDNHGEENECAAEAMRLRCAWGLSGCSNHLDDDRFASALRTIRAKLTLPGGVFDVLRDVHLAGECDNCSGRRRARRREEAPAPCSGECRLAPLAFSVGSMRPDVLLEAKSAASLTKSSDDSGQRFGVRICEINARFGFNGYLLSANADRAMAALLETGSDANFSAHARLRRSSRLESIPRVIFGSFDLTGGDTLFLLKGYEPGWDINLVEQSLAEYLGSEGRASAARAILPQNLAVDAQGFLTADLCCDSSHHPNGSDCQEECERTILPVRNAIVDLHQEEVEALDDAVLRGLARVPHVINDLRTVYCIHDKRLLALLSDRNVLQFLTDVPEVQSSILGSVIETHVIAGVRQNEDQYSQVLRRRHDWLAKPNLLGKGKGIVFGRNVSAEEWLDVVGNEAHDDWILQPVIHQAQFSVASDGVSESDNKSCLMTAVGMIHLWNGQYLGLGVWRAAQDLDCVSVAGGGIILLPATIEPDHVRVAHLPEPGVLMPPSGVRKRTLRELIDVARIHPFYKERTSKLAKTDGGLVFSDFPILEKEELRHALDASRGSGLWTDSVYVSPSGGTGGASMFVPCDVAENKFMRLEFSRQMQRLGGFWSRGRIYINLFSGLNLYRSLEIFQDYGEMCGCTILPMGFQATDSAVIKVMLEFGAEMRSTHCGFGIVASPTRAIQLARAIQEAGDHVLRTIDVQEIVFAAEPMHRSKREFLCDTFGRNLELRGVYGSAETGVWAFSCPPNHDEYLFDPSLVHCETVALSEDAVAKTESDRGRLVVTPLARLRFPLLRFDTGDVASLMPQETAKQLRKFRLHGRDAKSGSFLLGHGYFLSDPLLAAVRELPGVVECQLMLQFGSQKRAPDRLVVCVSGTTSDLTAVKDTARLELLKQQSSDVLFDVDACSVAPENLARAPVSQKILRVIDQRQDNS